MYLKANEELLEKVENRLAKINEDIDFADEKIAEWQERKRKLLSEKEANENKRIVMIVSINNISGTELKKMLSFKDISAIKPVQTNPVNSERKNENEDEE